MLRQRQPRVHSAGHLAFIRSLPCCICSNNIETEACHIRHSGPDKPHAGIAQKPDDRWTVPMCGAHHRKQHSMNERAFWVSQGIDPLKLAVRLWGVSGDYEAGCSILQNIVRLPQDPA